MPTRPPATVRSSLSRAGRPSAARTPLSRYSSGSGRPIATARPSMARRWHSIAVGSNGWQRRYIAAPPGAGAVAAMRLMVLPMLYLPQIGGEPVSASAPRGVSRTPA
ncbi:hypothetical protein C2142_04840 [Streptomyces sp. CB01881]|nr:hypothetical protein C2142_04840 [Streptomyces sp. CB01881]